MVGDAGDSGGAGGFHSHEAIAAVQDEDPYLGDEDYDDYDDLYNDVNVGESFIHSVPTKVDDVQQQTPPPLPPPPAAPSVALHAPKIEEVPIPGLSAPPKVNEGVGLEKPVVGYQDMGFRENNSESLAVKAPPLPGAGGMRHDSGQFGTPGFANEGFARPVGGVGGAGMGGNLNYGHSMNNGGGGGGGTMLFVGDLHWWTTDAQLEAELCKYGQVKEVKFFDEKASGKSKGFCQVEFFDPMAAAACREGMNGHIFNGKPCSVASASPSTIRRMGDAQVSRNLSMVQNQSSSVPMKSRVGGGVPQGGNFGGRGGPGGNWGRGGGGVGGRGNMGNIRNRMGPIGGRGIMGNGAMMNPPPPPMMHPGGMMGQGFDPMGGYGPAMGRMGGGFGAFPAGSAAPFPGILPSFPPVVAPHLNPAFFARGMAPGGGMRMWPDPNAGGWGGEEQSSFGEDAASDHQYGDGQYADGSHGKDRAPEKDWSGPPERKYREDRERETGSGQDWHERRHFDDRDASRDREREREKDRERERDREREKEREREREKERDRERERERERDRNRERDRERERERERYRDERERHGDPRRHREHEEWDRGQASRPRSKSREVEHSKRRRLTPER